MTNIPSSDLTDGVPTYTRRGDRAGRFADYYPAWIDNLADDVTIEGSLWTAQPRARRPSGRSSAPGPVVVS